MKKNRW